MLQGTQNQRNGLWEVPLAQEQCNMTYMSNNSRAIVRFLYAALGSPSISTITQAIRDRYLKSWPGLTITNITKHIQYNDATMKGYMDRVRKNIRSTKNDLGEDKIEQEIKTHSACAPSQNVATSIPCKLYDRLKKYTRIRQVFFPLYPVKALDMFSYYTIMILSLF